MICKKNRSKRFISNFFLCCFNMFFLRNLYWMWFFEYFWLIMLIFVSIIFFFTFEFNIKSLTSIFSFSSSRIDREVFNFDERCTRVAWFAMILKFDLIWVKLIAWFFLKTFFISRAKFIFESSFDWVTSKITKSMIYFC